MSNIWDDDEIQAPSRLQSLTQRVQGGNALPIISHAAILDTVSVRARGVPAVLRGENRVPLPEYPRCGPARELRPVC